MPGPLGAKSIGELRHRVAVQAADETADDFGQVTQEWDTEATVWAAVEPVSGMGRELFASGQVQANATHKVTCRYRAGVTAKKRLVWLTGGGLVLNVVAVFPAQGCENYLEIWCVRPDAG